MTDQNARHKAARTRKPTKQIASAPLTRQSEEPADKSTNIAGRNVSSRLEKAISELQGLQELLLSDDLDSHVLADFRDSVNRVRNAAWVAQQSVARKESDQHPSSVFSLMAGERIRAAYQLCRSISDDLRRTDIKFQAGSLVHLHEVMKALTEQLEGIIGKPG